MAASCCLIWASSSICCCLHRLDLALRVFHRVADRREGGGRQRAGGAALVEIAAAGQRGLGDGLRLVGLLVGRGVDQDHLQRRLLEDAVEGLRVDEAHGQQRGMHDDRHAERDLQRAEVAQVHVLGLSAVIRARPRCASVSVRSTAMAIGPATSSSSLAALVRRRRLGRRCVEALDAPCRARRARSRRSRRACTRTRAPRGRPCVPSHREHQRQRVGAHQAPFGTSLMTRRRRVR